MRAERMRKPRFYEPARDEFGLRCSIGSHRGWCETFPEQIHGDADEHDDQAGPGVLRLVAQQLNLDEHRNHEVSDRQHWITEGFVRARHVWPFPAKDEEAAEREDIKDQHGE